MVGIKRIISLLLVIASALCVFLTSCGADNTVQAFAKAVDKTEYTNATVTTKTENILGVLTGEYEITSSADGSVTIKYSYENWFKVDEGSETDVKKTVSGTVVRDKDGKYTGDVEGLNINASESGVIAINVMAISEDSVVVSEDGSTLEAVVSKEDSVAVFGIEYEFSVSLKMEKSEGKITCVTMSYETDGVKCEITSCYS